MHSEAAGAIARAGAKEDLAIEPSASLLERLAAGDRSALARVTRMTTACLRRLGAYDLGDECQDLCQEVVWALVRAVREKRAPDDDNTHAYVAGIVRNQFVSWLRRRGTQPGAHAAAAAGEHSAVESAADAAHADGGASYDGRVEARRALAQLPHEWQSLLVAHYVEGCTIDMLVASNGTPRATLNREIKRAREAFRACLLGEREQAVGGGSKAPHDRKPLRAADEEDRR